MNLFKYIISLFKSNKDIPNPRPKPLPRTGVPPLREGLQKSNGKTNPPWKKTAPPPPSPEIINDVLEIQGDCIIIHYPTFEGTKAVIDALNYLKIKQAFEKQDQKGRRKPPPPKRPPSRKIIPKS